MSKRLKDSKLVEFQRNLIADEQIPLSIKFRLSGLFLKEFYQFDRSIPHIFEEKVELVINNIVDFVNFCKIEKTGIDAKGIVFIASILLSTCCCFICQNQLDFYIKHDITFSSSSLIGALKFEDVSKIIYELGFIQGMETAIMIY